MQFLSITTDVFRCREFGMQSVAENARWLRGLFYNVFPSDDFTSALFISDCDQGQFRVTCYRQAHDLPENPFSWAKLINTTIPKQDEDLFADLLNARLVIGWGLTPALIQLLDRHEIDFLDVEVDPIRFGDDLFLRIRTNCQHLRDHFSSLHIDEGAFFSPVAEIRAFVARRDAPAAREGCSYGLFAGQCSVDLSLVKEGLIKRPEDFIDEIRGVANGVDILLVKSHPLDKDTRHLDLLLDAVPNARMTNSHIYRILSDVNLKHVVAMSSSVLDEAVLFGVETTRLLIPDRDVSDLIPSSISPWYRVSAEILADRNLACALVGKSYRPNFIQGRFNLRRSLNTNWSLPELYSSPRLSLEAEARRRGGPKLTRRSVETAVRSMFKSSQAQQ